MRQPQVRKAEPYDPSETGSLGKASMMLFRQYRFPDTYDRLDALYTVDHDIVMKYSYEHDEMCFKKHLHTGEMGLMDWFLKASDTGIMAFIKEYTDVEKHIEWSGYRVTMTVHRGNGAPVWTLELFAKHPDSDTAIYTGPTAPNVGRPRKSRSNRSSKRG